MDCYKLLSSILVIFICVIGGCLGQNSMARYECYDCTYFKGMAEMNPNCKNPESTTPIREDCEICSESVYKNATRMYIKRSCTRLCENGREYPVQYQDLENVKVKEYCCRGNLCNFGNGSGSYHQVAAVVMSTSLAAVLLSVILYLQ